MEQPQKKELSETEKLTNVMERIYRRQTFQRIFFSGVVAGLGSAIGATLVFALVVFLLSKVNLIPIVGDWLGMVIDEALKSIPQR
jgi:hypothetical protein